MYVDTNNLYKNKGITLIALVITIIILLILAGITIGALTGDNGLFTKAKEATNKYNESQIKEEIELAIVDIQFEELDNNRSLNMMTIVNKLPQIIENNGEDITIQIVGDQAKGTYKGKNFIITNKFEVILNKEIEDKLTIIPNNIHKNENGIYTLPNLSIYNPKKEEAKAVIIQFASGITQGDKIQLKDTTNIEVLDGDSFLYIKTESLSTDEIAEYLRNNLEFNLQKTDKIDNITVKISLTDEDPDRILKFCSATNHYYEYVEQSGITWVNAKKAAEQRTYFGQQGYLATITSKEEDDFTMSLIDENGWVGGSCHYEYIFDKDGNRIYSSLNQSSSNWHWVTGPESGEKFYDSSDTVNKYTNWLPNEPNNPGVENFLHLHAKLNGWNNIANNNPSINGYIVEYGNINGIGSEDMFSGNSKASSQVFIEL